MQISYEKKKKEIRLLTYEENQSHYKKNTCIYAKKNLVIIMIKNIIKPEIIVIMLENIKVLLIIFVI